MVMKFACWGRMSKKPVVFSAEMALALPSQRTSPKDIIRTFRYSSSLFLLCSFSFAIKKFYHIIMYLVTSKILSTHDILVIYISVRIYTKEAKEV